MSWRGVIVSAIAALACLSAGPASQPVASAPDAALWAKLTEIDSRAAKVVSLVANFEQEKFTALLRKPLVSSGRVRVKGSAMRWETLKPEANILLIDQHEAKVYYPGQKILEVYPLDSKLGDLAASPLPRLDVLKARFSFEQIPVSELEKNGDAEHFIALRLEPTEVSLREHVKQVRVLLDVSSACVVKAEVTDSDGDRTMLTFKDVQLNAEAGDLSLIVPPGTTVSHPLEGLDGQPSRTQGSTK